MTNNTADNIYRDVKKLIKKIVKITIITGSVIIIGNILFYAYEKYETSVTESKILKKAFPFTESLTPLVFVRDDFGTKTELKLWLIPDTNKHAIIKIRNNYSVFSTRISSDGTLNFYRKAGDSCSYSENAHIDKNNRILSVSCNFIDYYRHNQSP